MKVNEIQEHEDGSGTFNFEMSDDEQNQLFRIGLNELLNKNVKNLESTSIIVLDSCNLLGDKNVFEFSETQYNMLVEEGIIESIKSGIKSVKS